MLQLTVFKEAYICLFQTFGFQINCALYYFYQKAAQNTIFHEKAMCKRMGVQKQGEIWIFIKHSIYLLRINKMSDRMIRETQLPLSSNDVLEYQKERNIIYYLPCYVRFLVKQINNVDKEEMSASVSGTLIFSFYYGNIQDGLISQLICQPQKTPIRLEFNLNKPISLKQGQNITLRHYHKQKIIDFVVRQTFDTFIKGDLFLTPFAMLNLYLQVVPQTVHIKSKKNNKQVQLKFNCMDSTKALILRNGEDFTFGMYRVAPSDFEVKYTNNREYPFHEEGCDTTYKNVKNKPQVVGDDEIKNYHYAHFKISIYQFPTSTILTVFIPIWILCVICLLTFFQENELSSRLGTVAVLVLAFVSFVPTINASIPPTPNIKLVDILIIMNLSSIVFLMASSFDFYYNNMPADRFDWRGSNLFKASIAFNSCTFFVILLLYILHKCCWQPNYNRADESGRKIYKKIDKSVWQNEKLDQELQKVGNIHVYNPRNPER